jgi:hypothetical protein
MSDAPNPPARTQKTETAATASAKTSAPKRTSKPKTKELSPVTSEAAPVVKVEPEPAPEPVKSPKPEIEQTTAGPVNKGGWNTDFRRGWEDYEKGEDNRAEYRGDPAKTTAKDAYISGHTGAANYARLQKTRAPIAE